jgi:hypothetical protein
MNRSSLLLVFALLFNSTTLTAQKAHWTKLFDGKTLNGWNQKNGQAKYYVEKGEIIGETVANTPNSFLCTNQEYGDFILELELKVRYPVSQPIQTRSTGRSGAWLSNGN